MKMFDLLRIAIKTIKGKWAAFPAFAVAVGMFCLCFSGAAWTAVEHEKSLPYELVVSSAGTEKLTPGKINQISEIADVKAVTGVLQCPVSIKSGKYESQITLIGIDGAYLQEQFSKGAVFSDNSTMPYIVW